MKINGTDVEDRDLTYLIAEIGVNYFDIAEEQDTTPILAAKEMVKEAAEAGVDAVKFQSYSADSIASKHSPAYWDTDEEETESQYELFDKYDDFDADEFEEIAAWTDDNFDVDFLSTPFDFHAVDYLDDLVPAYKVASADLTNDPLLREIAEREKPILLSTGASTIGEIDDALRTIDETGGNDVALLHCILEYPTKASNANLGMISHLERAFPEYTIGYSDHVPPDDGMITLLHAKMRGADVIEKHFTLDKTLEGNDHYHAMDPDDVRTFREHESLLSVTTGASTKEPIPVESDSRKYARRSLVAAEAIDQGEEITRRKLAIKRPGTGISPKMLDVVLGRTSQVDIAQDEIITWDMV